MAKWRESVDGRDQILKERQEKPSGFMDQEGSDGHDRQEHGALYKLWTTASSNVSKERICKKWMRDDGQSDVTTRLSK